MQPEVENYILMPIDSWNRKRTRNRNGQRAVLTMIVVQLASEKTTGTRGLNFLPRILGWHAESTPELPTTTAVAAE